jgi:hypothetical protein
VASTVIPLLLLPVSIMCGRIINIDIFLYQCR